MQAGDHHEELPQPGRHRPGEAVAGPEEETTRTRGKLGTLTLTIPKTIPWPWGNIPPNGSTRVFSFV